MEFNRVKEEEQNMRNLNTIMLMDFTAHLKVKKKMKKMRNGVEDNDDGERERGKSR